MSADDAAPLEPTAGAKAPEENIHEKLARMKKESEERMAAKNQTPAASVQQTTTTTPAVAKAADPKVVSSAADDPKATVANPSTSYPSVTPADPKAVVSKAADPRGSKAGLSKAGAADAKAVVPQVAGTKADLPPRAASNSASNRGSAVMGTASRPSATGKGPAKAAVPKAADATAKAAAEDGNRRTSARGAGGGEMVWYPIDAEGEWAPCKLIARVPGGGITLKIKGKDVSVTPEDVASKLLPKEGSEKLTQNLVELPRDGLGPEGVEDVLRQQVCNMLPYTNIADVLVAVNPMREMPIYDAKWIDKYAELKPGLPPHVYNAAAMAFKMLTEKKMNQAIILCGSIGSGKSQAMAHLLGFLIQTAGSDPVDQLLGKLELALRPFFSLRVESGNLNWLSTRAFLALELHFDDDDFVCRATASVKMLESQRVAELGDGFNFDAICLAICDRDEAEKWLGDKVEFKVLGQEFDVEEYDADGKELKKWHDALKAFSIDPAQVVRLLCGLVLLGEVQFKTGSAGMECSGHEEAGKALGIDAAQLSAVLAESGDVSRANEMRQWIIEEIYRTLLGWLEQKINSAMVGDSSPTGLTITIVDVPAFPSGYPATLSAPSGFNAMQLQWLLEAVGTELHCCGHFINPQQVEEIDVTRLPRHKVSENVFSVIAGSDHNSLFSLINRELAKSSGNPPPAKLLRVEVEAWGKLHKDASGVTFKDAGGKMQMNIAGWFSKASHRLDERLVHGAAVGKLMPETAKKILSQSSVKLLTEIVARLSAETMALHDAEGTVKMVRGFLQGKGKVRPWLVCCLRPNDKGSNSLVSQPVLLNQVRSLLLAEMVHFLGEKKLRYIIAWSIPEFRTRFSSLMPALDRSMGDIEACRIIVQSVGGGQGTVGGENVYGTKELLQILEVKMKEKEGEAKAKDEYRQDMDKMLSSKIGGLEKKQEEAEMNRQSKIDAAVEKRVQEQMAAQRTPSATPLNDDGSMDYWSRMKSSEVDNGRPSKITLEIPGAVQEPQSGRQSQSIERTASNDDGSAYWSRMKSAEVEEHQPSKSTLDIPKSVRKPEAGGQSPVDDGSDYSFPMKSSEVGNDRPSKQTLDIPKNEQEPQAERQSLFAADDGDDGSDYWSQSVMTGAMLLSQAQKANAPVRGNQQDQKENLSGNLRSVKAPEDAGNEYEAELHVFCPKCQARYIDSSPFCGRCGEKRPDLKQLCENCSTIFQDDSAFCRKCGTKRTNEMATAYRRLDVAGSKIQKENEKDIANSTRSRPSLLSKGTQQTLRRMTQGSSDFAQIEIDRLVEGSSLPSETEDDILAPKNNRGPLRSMSLPQHATLHSALSQMSAVLRVAKASEAKMREGHQSRHSEVEELRQEANAWRIESDRLWIQVKDLQQQLQWKPQSA